MAINTSSIPIKDVIEREAVVTLSERVRWNGQVIYKGPCPFCGGGDRFAAFEDDNTFLCGINKGNGCDKHGDVITFLQEYHKWTFSQALDHLKEQYGLVLDGTAYEHVKSVRREEKDEAPCEQWQKRGIALVKEACDFLWSDGETPRKARNYLLKRGLTEATIKQWKLGYVETERYDARSAWGLDDITDKEGKVHTQLYIPRGWLIPWLSYPDLWRIDIRRHPTDIKKAAQTDKPIGKYHQIKGSSQGLFNASAIKEDYPLIVVESPIDAIVGTQETTLLGRPDEFIWCATGATGGARKPQWCEAMRQAYPVLMAFDADSAGNKAFGYWREQTFAPFRWIPTAHDINDMALTGHNVMEWAVEGMEIAIELDVILHPEVLSGCQEVQPEHIELLPVVEQGQVNQPERNMAIVEDLAAVFPDGCLIEMVDQAFAERIHNLPEREDERAPLVEKQDRLCPYCEQAGKKASGIVVIPGKYHNQDKCEITPEKPFYYAWIASERIWWCPSCKNVQKSLPVCKERVEWAA